MSISLNKLAFFALWLFVFAIPWERTVSLPVIGTAGSLLGVLAFGAGFLSLFSKQDFRVRRPSLFLLVAAAFAAWSFLSYFWSITPTGTVGRAQTNLQLLLMVFLIWQLCRTPAQQRALLQAYVWGAYLLCSSVVVSFLIGASVSASGRFSGLGGNNPNWIALTMALAIPLALQLASGYKNGFLSWVNFLYLPAALFAISLTASRGGLITALVGSSLLLLSFGSLSLPRKTLLLLMLPAAIYGLFAVVPPENLARLGEASTEISEGDLTARGAIWAAAFEIIPEAPILGYGSGSFSTAIIPALGFSIPAHNSFISVTAELGAVGIVLFTSLFLLAIAPFLLPDTPDRWFYLILWLALLTANTPANWEYNKVSWVLLALMTTRKAFVLPISLPSSYRSRYGSVRREQGQPSLPHD